MHPLLALRRGRSLFVLAAMAIAASGSACADGPSGGDAGVVDVAGDLEVASGDAWIPAEEGLSVRAGSEVRTGTEEARVVLADGALWLAPGTAAVLHRDRVELLQGDVVLQADRELAVSWGTMSAEGVGVFRMRLGSAPRVGVYRGTVTVVRPGEQSALPALRQVVLSGRRLSAPAPLSYRTDDPWDAVWMDQAIQLDAETERLARGIERSYGAEPQPAEFYAEFADDGASEWEGVLPLLARTARARDGNGGFGPPSETLLTLFVAQATERERLDEAVRGVVALRGEGARWGLVGVELDVSSERLAGVVDLGHARQVAAADPQPLAASSGGTPVDGGAPPPAGDTTPPPRTTAPPGAPDQPSPPSENPDDEPPLEYLADPLQELLGETLDPTNPRLGID